ncbi:unnamed protein product [Rotaria sordida]|uniref:Uncharacterized protein n=1 Tax=Rotaria sordida TaxID=392033 RepID=A0A819YQI6_9BILA|nr:unnamed protein product [Rotaria sordida]CAF1350245.1 unnamed protein product [Rotaria sordida]CAF4160661.1 unnamed protein product [Rotaria sordida]CAF4173878.1 unnamed protein product [Rotaria sordida]
MNLALYSRQSAGKKDLLRSVRRIITTELENLNPDDYLAKMFENISSNHLKLFPLHDHVRTRIVEIND